MKKIFSIIAAVMSGLVIALLVTTCFIKTNVNSKANDPKFIYVFDKSTTATVSNGYNVDSKEYKDILNNLNKLTRVSIFDRLVNNTDVKPTFQQDVEGKYSKWTTDLKLDNIVVELVYDQQQDMVVYVGEDTRVISYFCLAYVIPLNNKFSDLIIYYSITNSDSAKDESYADCTPISVKCKAGKFNKFVSTL